MLLYVYTSDFIKNKLFLFGCTREATPVTLYVYDAPTYFYVMTSMGRSKWNRLGFEGEKKLIQSRLAEVNINVNAPIVERKYRMDSYSPDRIPHYKVPFNNYDDMAKAKSALIKNGYNVAETPSGKDKFFTDHKLLTCQWVEIDDDNLIECSLSFGESKRGTKEYAVRGEHIVSSHPVLNDKPLPPPAMKMMSFDCEVNSSRFAVDGSRAHPDPSIKKDIIYSMSIVLHDSDAVNISASCAQDTETSEYRKLCICVLAPELWDAKLCEEEFSAPNGFELEGVEMYFVKSEEELLSKFSEIVREEDPDVLYGYNIFKFDFWYMSRRAMLYEIESYGRIRPFQIDINGTQHELDIPMTEQYHKESWEGAGKSWHSFVAPHCYGRICLDTFNNTKLHKPEPGTPGALQSLKLDDVGEFFVNQRKLKVKFTIAGVEYEDYAATYMGYRSGNAEMIKTICEYCVRDSVVTMLVMDKLKGWSSARESAIIFQQDVKDVTCSGQTKHIKNRVLRMAEENDYVYHPIERNVKMKLEGGFVINPLVGTHDNVACADFSGMYPSVQNAYNICPSCFKKMLGENDNPDDWTRVRVPILLDRIDLPVEMEDYTGPDGEPFDIDKIDDQGYIDDLFEYNHFRPEFKAEFVQTVKEEHDLAEPKSSYYEMYFLKNTIRVGVFPMLLNEYRNSRKEYKRGMKAAKESGDMIAYEIFNQKQNAVKVAMNSVYGICGSQRGMFSFVEGSAAITFLGRSAIKEVAESFKQDGCRIVYGDTDSVMIQAPGYINRGLTAPLDQDSMVYFEKKVKWINDVLLADRQPMEIELEKILNAVFITKKRYGGKTIWPEEAPFYRGVSAVRGDMFPYGKKIYTTAFSMIMQDKSRDDIKEVINNLLDDLDEGRIPNEMLAVSKMLAHSYALQSAPMNVYSKYLQSIGEVAEPGTKIPLVVTRPPLGMKATSRGHYYRLPNTTDPIDYDYYTNFALKPVQQLVSAAYFAGKEIDAKHKANRMSFAEIESDNDSE